MTTWISFLYFFFRTVYGIATDLGIGGVREEGEASSAWKWRRPSHTYKSVIFDEKIGDGQMNGECMQHNFISNCVPSHHINIKAGGVKKCDSGTALRKEKTVLQWREPQSGQGMILQWLCDLNANTLSNIPGLQCFHAEEWAQVHHGALFPPRGSSSQTNRCTL